MRDMILVGVMVALKKKGLGLRKLRKVVPTITPDVTGLLLYPEGTRGFNKRGTKRVQLQPPLNRVGVKVTIRKRLSNATRITTLKVSLRDILNRIR